jgi:hypothetical protein
VRQAAWSHQFISITPFRWNRGRKRNPEPRLGRGLVPSDEVGSLGPLARLSTASTLVGGGRCLHSGKALARLTGVLARDTGVEAGDGEPALDASRGCPVSRLIRQAGACVRRSRCLQRSAAACRAGLPHLFAHARHAAGPEPVRHPVCLTGPIGAVPMKGGLCPGCDELSEIVPRDDPICFASLPAGAA